MAAAGDLVLPHGAFDDPTFNGLADTFILTLPYLTDRLESPKQGMLFGKAGPKATECMKELGYLKAAVEGLSILYPRNEALIQILTSFQGIDVTTTVLPEAPSLQAKIVANIKLFFDTLEQNITAGGTCNESRIVNFLKDEMKNATGVLNITYIRGTAAKYISGYNQMIKYKIDDKIMSNMSSAANLTKIIAAGREEAMRESKMARPTLEQLRSMSATAGVSGATFEAGRTSKAYQIYGGNMTEEFKNFVLKRVASVGPGPAGGAGRKVGGRRRKSTNKRRTTRRYRIRKSRRHQ
jgi:hypothetical protein